MQRYKVRVPLHLLKKAEPSAYVYELMPKGTVLTRVGSGNGYIQGFVTIHGVKYRGWADADFLDEIVTAKPIPQTLRGRIIVNDIGHGVGNRSRGVYDPGAVAGGQHEHKVVEAFVDALTAAQRARGASVTVLEDMPLKYRKANPAADATSYHINAGGGTGVEVLVPWLAGSASRAKSDRIGRAIAAALGLQYRGIKRTAKLAVLNRGFDRMVELYFIDSASDRKAFAVNRAKAIAAVLANV